MKKALFEEEHISSIAIISIIFVLILFLFISIGFIKDVNKIFNQEQKITGFAAEDMETINQSESSEEPLYSMKSYAVFYFSVIGLIFIILIVSFFLMLPGLKKYT
jgi:hypothetical protein